MDFNTAASRIINGEFTEADIASYDFDINAVQERPWIEEYSMLGDSDSETEEPYLSSTTQTLFFNCRLLHLALIAKNRKAVEALLKQGADPALTCMVIENYMLFVPPYTKQQSSKACNALDLAKRLGLSDIIALIKAKLAERTAATAGDAKEAELQTFPSAVTVFSPVTGRSPRAGRLELSKFSREGLTLK